MYSGFFATLRFALNDNQRGRVLLHRFSEACSQPLLLLFDGHVAVVQQEGVFRLAKRTYFAVLVDVVTFLHVGQDLFE